MKIDRVGLSMFRIETERGLVTLLDPWISGNPTLVPKFNTPERFRKIDALFVSHGHLDHASGVADITEVNPEVAVICHIELGNFLIAEGVKNVQRLNIGGTFAIKEVSFTLVPAIHSSTYGPDSVWAGPATGIIITLENGYTVYYAGDTGLTAELKFVIGDYFQPDLAILPVGGVVTMDVEQAAYAAGEFIKARRVIPCHYFPVPEEAPDPVGMAKFLELWPLIEDMMGDKGNEFKAIMRQRYPHIEVDVLELGEGIEIDTSKR